MVRHLNSFELEELLISEKKPVFVDFWATWCTPCRMLAPIFEGLSDKYENKAVFVKVDVDENGEAAAKYGISSIPNIIAFQNGKKKANSLGFKPEDVLNNFIQENL